MQTAASTSFGRALVWVCAAAPLGGLIASCTYAYDDAWHCVNGRKDSDETDVDCGGSCARAHSGEAAGVCALSFGCSTAADCDRTGDEDGVLRASCLGGRCFPAKSVGRWEKLTDIEDGDASPPRRMAAGFAMHGDQALLYGGLDNEIALSDSRVFDATKDKWTSIPGSEDGPGPRDLVSAVDIPGTQETWVIGGCRKTDPRDSCGTGEAARTITAYDWLHRQWLAPHVPILPESRISAGVAIDTHRRQLVINGGPEDPEDPGDPGDLLQLALDEDDAQWVLLSHGGGPPARYGSPLVYMEAQRVFLMFGGAAKTGSVPGNADTWIYHPATDGGAGYWVDLSDVVGPSARTTHAMAYDADRQTAILFGGRHTEGITDGSDDTWEFDGASWREVRIVGEVATRSFHDAMVFDAARHRMLLHVGGKHFGLQGDPDENQYLYSQLWSLTMFGTPCEAPDDCGTGHCVDRVCCDSACETGVCNSLDFPGECQPE